MVRLSDLGPRRAALGQIPVPEFEGTPWVVPPRLDEARVAIVSTAGLHRRGDPPFTPASAREYRIIPGDADANDLLMSHLSVNFDRSGFQQDLNVTFPIDRLRELDASGEIGSLADWHYSFMGAVDPAQLQDTAADVAKRLQGDGVTAALLVPV